MSTNQQVAIFVNLGSPIVNQSMKQILQFVPVISVLLLAGINGRSQNLIANGSFEDANLCTEFHKYCAPEAWIATSHEANYYYSDMKVAYDGYRYVGLTAGSVNKKGARNFIRTQLICGLRKGSQYNVDFYVSATNKVLDSIGIYFSPEDFLYEQRSYRDIQPVYWYVRSGAALSQPPNKWQKVHYVYTATGNEAYLTIGLFKRTDYSGVFKPDFQDEYLFLLDKVSVTPVNPNEKICTEAEQETGEIYAQDDRHERLDKTISAHLKKPPVPRPKLGLTRTPYVQHIDTLIIPDIYFVSASYELSKKSFDLLDSFAHKITGSMDSVVVKGHTDSIGNLQYNQELSQSRAVSVKQYLMTKLPSLGVPFIARGYAFLEPIASNKTSSGRKKNRRVEIFVYRRE
ncbi:OmpA/MotB domain protein [Niastella koreensis GR20-10]|uniref:OmpA/MotB domain protein n=2 Tax=Niastella koreensis TaxID=354356 RepID=G8TKZ4_NIAKG|nr:OmpA/MotB domain protein [Niastella koreensis GR20-10]